MRGICVTEVSQKSEVNTSGLQVLHVLGPELPLLRCRKVHRTAVATMTGDGHLCTEDAQKSEVIRCCSSGKSATALEHGLDT